jgi:hypothetical protein
MVSVARLSLQLKSTVLKKNKKWVILLIVAFPSLFWLILESSTINSRKLAYYGPKTLSSQKDTVYYTVPGETLMGTNDTSNAYVAVFVKPEYARESYRLTGFWEFVNYKRSKIAAIKFVIAAVDTIIRSDTAFARLVSGVENVRTVSLAHSQFDKLNKAYFKHKPYFVDYSFLALIDAYGHIRGYYDGRFASEIKRLTGEYVHLQLKEEKKRILNENEVRKVNK